MNDNIKNGLLILITVATIANTIMLLGSDSVSYEKTAVKDKAVSNAAVTPNNTQAQERPNNQDQVNPQLNEKPTGPKTSIKFEEMAYDFGDIEQNSTNPKTFTFTNTGDKPLIISDAKASCGCTVPHYTREPIAPGGTGKIDVIYKPGMQANKQTKTVTITANTEPATTVLRISANVEPGDNPQPNQGQNSSPIEIQGQ